MSWQVARKSVNRQVILIVRFCSVAPGIGQVGPQPRACIDYPSRSNVERLDRLLLEGLEKVLGSLTELEDWSGWLLGPRPVQWEAWTSTTAGFAGPVTDRFSRFAPRDERSGAWLVVTGFCCWLAWLLV